jgi:uncharacterized protein
MPRAYRYVSGDSHLEIDSKAYLDRVPAEHRDRAPKVVRLPDGGDAWLVEGIPLREVPSDLYGGKGRDNWRPIGQAYETTPGTGSPEQRVREQDTDGIDAEVLFPGVSGPALWRNIADDDAYKAVVRAYNDYLGEEYCPVAPDRLIGLGVIPWTGVDDAIAEMEHCARMGLPGICLGTFPNGGGRPRPEDDRFWAAALEMGIAITAHEEFNRSGPRGGALLNYPNAQKQYVNRLANNPLREIAGQVAKYARLGGVNAVQLTLDGVFDRFPDLKVFFAETQIGWIPFFLEGADIRYDRHMPWARDLLGFKPLDRRPSEYIREHCYWGFQHDRVGVEMRHHIGVERLLWATDFPHQDSEYPYSMGIVEDNFAGVPDDERYAMVAGNAIAYFKLDAVDATPKPGAEVAQAR